MSQARVLILYYSRGGKTARLADEIADGVATVSGAEPCLRTVPAWSSQPSADNSSAPLIQIDELASAHALALGSPTRFGTMAAPLKHFWEQTTTHWLNGSLIDRPACVFTSTSTLHGGQEATLLSMMLPLLHHGMMLIGTPYDQPALHQTTSGGTPYGPSHWDRKDNDLSRDEQVLARYQGQRLARLALQLRSAE